MDLTKNELAELTGLTYRQIYNINRKLPEESKLFVKSDDDTKKCDAAFFVQRWVEYNVSQATADADDLDAVKAVHEKVKTRKTELEVARLEGTLVDVQEVRKLWGNIANTIMQSMIRLPSTLAPMLQGMDQIDRMEGIMDTEIRKVLEELADAPLPSYVLLQEGSEDTEDD